MQLRILLWLCFTSLGLSFSLRPRSLCGVKVRIFTRFFAITSCLRNCRPHSRSTIISWRRVSLPSLPRYFELTHLSLFLFTTSTCDRAHSRTVLSRSRTCFEALSIYRRFGRRSLRTATNRSVPMPRSSILIMIHPCCPRSKWGKDEMTQLQLHQQDQWRHLRSAVGM